MMFGVAIFLLLLGWMIYHHIIHCVFKLVSEAMPIGLTTDLFQHTDGWSCGSSQLISYEDCWG
jgi:hypothetical protein